MKCFIGISPSQYVRHRLFHIGQSMLSCCAGKAVEIENLHSTLFLWNRLTLSDIEQVKNGLEAVGSPNLKATVKGVDCFYHGEKPRILKAEIDSPQLEEIHRQLGSVFLEQRIEIDSRPLNLQITLLRIKHVDNTAVFNGCLESIKQKFEELSFCLDSITLYQSILMQTGPTYKIIHDYKLKEEGGVLING